MKTKQRILDNEKGQAMVESIPLVAIFILLMMYALGLFGVIHSGILFSIGARSYAFETFRNRTNTNIFRYSGNSRADRILHHEETGFRYHYVTDDFTGRNETSATARRITYGLNREPVSDGGAGVAIHNENAFNDIRTGERNQSVEVDPVWLMIGYGLCSDAQCGGEE